MLIGLGDKKRGLLCLLEAHRFYKGFPGEGLLLSLLSTWWAAVRHVIGNFHGLHVDTGSVGVLTKSHGPSSARHRALKGLASTFNSCRRLSWCFRFWLCCLASYCNSLLYDLKA